MASINGVKSGFIAVPQQKKEAPQKRAPKINEVTCSICGARDIYSGKGPNKVWSRDEDEDGEFNCIHCSRFFGLIRFSPMGGVTNMSPKSAAQRIAKAAESGYAMILRFASFGTPSGSTISIELGDIFPISRAGLAASDDAPSAERTKLMFSISINVGGNELVLFPHEFSPVGFVAIMAMRKDGEVLESFVGDDDKIGYFQPSPEVRAQIDAAFGKR